MPVPGYIEYKSREFCNDVKCPVQMKLDSKSAESEDFAKIKLKCEKCRFSARVFHHWLIEKGYLIIRPEK